MERWQCPSHRLPLRQEGSALICDGGHRYQQKQSEQATFIDFVDARLSELEHHQRQTYDATDSRYAVEDQDFMRRFARTFARSRVKGREELLRSLLDDCRLAASQRVLELGCNDGRYLNALWKRYGVEGCGIDLSEVAIRRALSLRLEPSLSFHVARADALPFCDGAFDLVISFDVFEHLGHPALRETLAEVSRVLKPGGKLLCYVISQRDRFTFHETLRRLTDSRLGVDDGEGHAFENFVSPEDFRAMCLEAGLRAEAVRAYHGFWTLFADEHLRSSPPRIIYKLLEWLDQPLTDLEYGNGFFGVAHKTSP